MFLDFVLYPLTALQSGLHTSFKVNNASGLNVQVRWWMQMNTEFWCEGLESDQLKDREEDGRLTLRFILEVMC